MIRGIEILECFGSTGGSDEKRVMEGARVETGDAVPEAREAQTHIYRYKNTHMEILTHNIPVVEPEDGSAGNVAGVKSA